MKENTKTKLRNEKRSDLICTVFEIYLVYSYPSTSLDFRLLSSLTNLFNLFILDI